MVPCGAVRMRTGYKGERIDPLVDGVQSNVFGAFSIAGDWKSAALGVRGVERDGSRTEEEGYGRVEERGRRD